MKFSALFLISIALSVSARPQLSSRALSKADALQNGQDAIALNNKFKSLTKNSACTSGQEACVGNGFAQCDNNKFVVTPCGGGTICAALPLVNKKGTSIACTTQADLNARIAATGASGASGAKAASGSSSSSSVAVESSSSIASVATGKNLAVATSKKGSASSSTSSAAASASATAASKAKGNGGNNGGNSGDAQKSLTLLQSVIAKGFENNGQDQPTAGQVASLTSSNNFINFCATVPNLPITNGQQVKTGSCNPAPMGIIAATTNMPSGKFQFPDNLGEVEENQAFTIKIAINNLETGHFVNAQENYYSAPQQINKAGNIQGHSHVVVELMTDINQKNPTDPTKFAFFKGLNDAGSVLTADVTTGLPAGVYRLASINTAANHQPCLVAIAQHGSLDDMIYFTVKKGANATAGAGGGSGSNNKGGKGGKGK